MRVFPFAVFLFIMIFPKIVASDPAGKLQWYASGKSGIVASGAQDATVAGLMILEKGGNAVDAAVATIFNLAVSDYGLFCIGGEVPFMSYSAGSGEIVVFNGMGVAPSDPDAIRWYYANGIPASGIRAATVPGAVSALLAALEQKGTKSFSEIIEPTLALLDSGSEPWYHPLAATLRRLVEAEENASGSRDQKIHAARDRFYKGDIADELDAYYRKSGAFLRKSDLSAYSTMIEKPVTVNYRGYSVNKCNTWTQGPVLLQSLNLIGHFDVRSMGFFSPDQIHLTVEAMKLAYADRDKYYGDPAFVKVPLDELLSDRYTQIRFPLIDMKTASGKIRPGDPVKLIPDIGPGEYWPGEKGTTTCVVADKWGNVVAATPSANPDYGICESLGIAHNTRLSSLNTQKGHPNSLEPGKRPRITLTPTIVLKENKALLAMSVAGGDMQDQVSLQLLMDVLDFGMLPKEAIMAPRFLTRHMQDSFNPSPDPAKRTGELASVDINSADKNLISELEKRGHKVTSSAATLAWPVLVVFDLPGGMAYGAGQPGAKTCAAVTGNQN